MNEDKRELLEGIELSDDMLEGISGGKGMSDYLKSLVRDLVMILKSDGKTVEQVVEYLSTKTPLGSKPDILADAIAYTRAIW